jgi:hypothetical protein
VNIQQVTGVEVRVRESLPAAVGYPLFQEYVDEAQGNQNHVPTFALAQRMIVAAVEDWDFPFAVNDPGIWDLTTLQFITLTTIAVRLISDQRDPNLLKTST